MRILELQPEGRRVMRAREFLAGRRVPGQRVDRAGMIAPARVCRAYDVLRMVGTGSQDLPQALAESPVQPRRRSRSRACGRDRYRLLALADGLDRIVSESDRASAVGSARSRGAGRPSPHAVPADSPRSRPPRPAAGQRCCEPDRNEPARAAPRVSVNAVLRRVSRGPGQAAASSSALRYHRQRGRPRVLVGDVVAASLAGGPGGFPGTASRRRRDLGRISTTAPAPLTLRINCSQTTREAVIASLAREGGARRAWPLRPGSLVVLDGNPRC